MRNPWPLGVARSGSNTMGIFGMTEVEIIIRDTNRSVCIQGFLCSRQHLVGD